MSRLTLRLPETLHEQLASLAENEGVSLNQYIVYALTRQVGTAYAVQVTSHAGIEQQAKSFNQWLLSAEQCSEEEAAKILSEREPAQADSKIEPEVLKRFNSLLNRSTQ